MALLLANQFKELPADNVLDTKLFLESVSHLPPFFGKYITPELATLPSGTVRRYSEYYTAIDSPF